MVGLEFPECECIHDERKGEGTKGLEYRGFGSEDRDPDPDPDTLLQ